MNWYHRAEGRYVEYGSSFEATRTFGLFRSLYDTVYNLNMGHLNHEALTVFERLGDAGLRTAGTPFLIYRGRHPPRGRARGPAQDVRLGRQVPPRGLGTGRALLRRALLLAEGELPADARPAERPRRLLGLRRPRPGRARPLRLPALLAARHRLLLPPRRPRGELARDRARRRRAQGARRRPRRDGRVPRDQRRDRRLRPRAVERRPSRSTSSPRSASAGTCCSPTTRSRSTTSSPSGRAAAPPRSGCSARAGDDELERRAAIVRDHIAEALEEEVELIAWLRRGGGRRRSRRGELRAALPSRRRGHRPPRRELDARRRHRRAHRRRPRRPLRLRRLPRRARPPLGGAHNPNAGDILLCLAPDWECVDWGGVTHIPGGSHGSLRAADSLGTLLTVGLDGERPEREQWAISDVADLVAGHFGLDEDRGAERPSGRAAAS